MKILDEEKRGNEKRKIVEGKKSSAQPRMSINTIVKNIFCL